MLRRGSAGGFLLLPPAVGLLFLPIASASNSSRPVQTLTVLVLVAAVSVTALTWLALRQRGYVRAFFFPLAALAGAFVCVWLIAFIPELAAAPKEDVMSRLLIYGLLNGAGIWLFVVAVRRIFPRPNRGMAAAAIVLVLLSLFPVPRLLVQKGVDELGIGDIELQLQAGSYYWTVGAALLVAPFVAMMTLPGDWFERGWAETSRWAMSFSNRAYAIALMLLAFSLAMVFATYSFDRHPTTADEIAQLWHARMLLSGKLAMPPDPNPEFFAIDNIIDRPHWMSQFPIGGPAVLAVGLFFGAAWLVNPILTALIAFNVYRFAQRAYGEAQARAAALVVIVSPMLLLMGGTHMNHTPTAWLVTLALASLPVWTAATRPEQLYRSTAVIGASVGAAISVRPLDGVVAGAAFGLFMLAVAVRERARARSLLAAMAAGAVPVVLLLLANWSTTGHPLRFGYEVLWGANHSLGLHDDPTGHPHTAWRAFLIAVKYLAQLNWIMTSWPVPALLIAAVGLMLARRRHRWDVLLLSMFGAQLLVYSFYWHSGQFAGPRFLFTVIPALLILVARAPFLAADRLRSGVWWRIAVVLIPVCIGVSWLRYMRPFGVRALAAEFRESRTRLKLDPPPEIESGVVRNALVFVQEGTSARLLHRLWGLGVSRPDAARILAKADGCSLADAVLAEERRAPGDTAGRLARIERMLRPFRQSPRNLQLPDGNLRVTDSASVTPACAAELAQDHRVKNTVAYGPMLLHNRFEHDRVGGSAIFVMNLGPHNEVLRERFRDRSWFRYEAPRERPGTVPILVPYDSPP